MSNETTETETIGIIKTVRNKKVIELLKKQGKNVIEFPEIKIEKIEPGETEKNLLENISEFDWLVFTDIFTVDFFIEDLEKTGFELYRLDELKICSCGEAVSDKLRFSQIHSDVVPQSNSADSMLSGIGDYIFDEEEFRNSTFLIISGENENEEISNVFAEHNLQTAIVKVYKIAETHIFETAKLKSLISGGAIDRFIFTSPEDWESFSLIIDENISLNEIEFESTDDTTAQTLRENSHRQKRWS